MPSRTEILASLTQIANSTIPVAILWHIALLAAAFAVLRGVRPNQRSAKLIIVAPLVSVSVIAWIFHNPFNGALFALASALLGFLALRSLPVQLAPAQTWAVGLGLVLVGFGFLYPHFLVGYPAIAYLYAAPFGTLPCPTLAVCTGVALLAGDLGRGVWGLGLTALAAFYAIVGVFSLGVYLDCFLMLGPAGLLVQRAQIRSQAQPGRRSSPI